MADEKATETRDANENLRHKLTSVMADVFGVPKKGKNTQPGAGYTYQRAADILPKVQKALCYYGIAFLAHELSVEFPPSHETKSGGVMFVAVVKMRYTFIDTTGDERLECDSSGMGFDTSDKALNKAKTAALKYFLKQTFLIGEEDDDSERDTHEVTRPLTLRPEPPRERHDTPEMEASIKRRLAEASDLASKDQKKVLGDAILAKFKGDKFLAKKWLDPQLAELDCTRENMPKDKLQMLLARIATWHPTPINDPPPADASLFSGEKMSEKDIDY